MRLDVKDITEAEVRSWYFRFPQILCIHLWAGFPCVDLSSVKFNRMNLEGKESKLFFEILRIIRLIRKVFGVHFVLKFFVENVSSMDKEAATQVSDALGTLPYKVQCSDAVPVSRPRFCWTNQSLDGLPGISIVKREYYFEVTAEAPYPSLSQWIREDSEWPGGKTGAILPTCMKSIKRQRAPPRPAGIARTRSLGSRLLPLSPIPIQV